MSNTLSLYDVMFKTTKVLLSLTVYTSLKKPIKINNFVDLHSTKYKYK